MNLHINWSDFLCELSERAVLDRRVEMYKFKDVNSKIKFNSCFTLPGCGCES